MSEEEAVNKSDKEVKETRGAKEKQAEAEEYSPLFVPSIPPRIISKKYKTDPEKWKRNRGSIFRNSCRIHTSGLEQSEKLISKDDEKSSLDASAIKTIAGQFKTRRVFEKNMGKYILSKTVYYRCEDYEKEMELRREKEELRRQLEEENRAREFELMTDKRIESYVQFAPEDLSEPWRKAVCMWYKVEQYAKRNSPYKTERYFDKQLVKLRELFDENEFGVYFMNFLLNLHVLLTASNLYRRIYHMELVHNKFERKGRKKPRKYRTEHTSISDVLDLIKSNVMNEEAGQCKKTYNESIKQASRAFFEYMRSTCTDEENAMGARKLADEIKQIYTEKVGEFGDLTCTFLEFFDYTKMIVSFSDEKFEDDDEKAARVLTVFLEGPDVPEKAETNNKPAEACKAITVEEFFSPEVLKQLEWYKPGQKRLTRKERDALKMQKQREQSQMRRWQQDVQEYYELYLRSKNDKDAQKQAGFIKGILRELTDKYGTDRHEYLLYIFERRKDIHGVEEYGDIEDLDVKRVKLFAVLLDGPTASEQDGKTCVSEGETKKFEVYQEIKVEDFFSPEILKQLMNLTKTK